MYPGPGPEGHSGLREEIVAAAVVDLTARLGHSRDHSAAVGLVVPCSLPARQREDHSLTVRPHLAVEAVVAVVVVVVVVALVVATRRTIKPALKLWRVLRTSSCFIALFAVDELSHGMPVNSLSRGRTPMDVSCAPCEVKLRTFCPVFKSHCYQMHASAWRQ